MEQILGVLVVVAIIYAAYRLLSKKDSGGSVDQPPSNPKDDGTRHN